LLFLYFCVKLTHVQTPGETQQTAPAQLYQTATRFGKGKEMANGNNRLAVLCYNSGFKKLKIILSIHLLI